MWNRRPAQDEMKSRELSILVTHVRIDTSSCQTPNRSRITTYFFWYCKTTRAVVRGMSACMKNNMKREKTIWHLHKMKTIVEMGVDRLRERRMEWRWWAEQLRGKLNISHVVLNASNAAITKLIREIFANTQSQVVVNNRQCLVIVVQFIT